MVGIGEELKRRKWKAPAEFLKSLKEREQAKEESNEKKASEKLLEGKLNPLNLLSRLDKVILGSIRITKLHVFRFCPKMRF